MGSPRQKQVVHVSVLTHMCGQEKEHAPVDSLRRETPTHFEISLYLEYWIQVLHGQGNWLVK